MTPTPADDMASGLLSLIALLGEVPLWLQFSDELLGIGVDMKDGLFKSLVADAAAVFTIGANIMYTTVRTIRLI